MTIVDMIIMYSDNIHNYRIRELEPQCLGQHLVQSRLFFQGSYWPAAVESECVCVCVCVCEGERERERERGGCEL